MKEQRHEIAVRATPVNTLVQCTCGWSRTVPRQNALARAAKVRRHIREHEDEVDRKKSTK